MSTQRQVPGGPYVNETASAQRQVPGGQYINETVVAAGGGITGPLVHGRHLMTNGPLVSGRLVQ